MTLNKGVVDLMRVIYVQLKEFESSKERRTYGLVVGGKDTFDNLVDVGDMNVNLVVSN